MKTRKILSATGVLLVSGIILAACGNSSSTSDGSTYTYVYTEDPSSLDYVTVNRAQVSDVTGNLIDGLLENDSLGNLVPSIAESWEVSEDGLTYTYKLREDAKWYTSEGEEYANVTAQDFVTGLKHAADKNAEGLYLVENSIKGLADYVSGANTDFTSVGIKAVDDYTLEYTLTQAEPYWNSKTTNGVLFPINAEFLKSQGDKFGEVDPASILYNGPYLLTGLTSKSSLEFTKNENYYDAEDVHISNVKLSYMEGSASDQESLVKNFTDGIYTSARLYPASSNYASVEKQYKDNIVYSPQDGTSYFYSFNIARSNYTNSAKTTDAQKEATKKAIANKDFRQAINFAFDRAGYSAQTNGEDAATKTLRNSLVPPTFVKTDNATFGELVEQDLQAYGDEWKDINLDDAQDAFFNETKAKEEFAKAKATLEAEGVEFPIHLDVPVDQSREANVKQNSSLKDSIERVLGTENVIVDLNMLKADEFENLWYANNADQIDYDLSSHGWGPDYLDPSTFLDILNPSDGAQTIYLGFNAGKSTDITTALGMDTFEALNKEASGETSNTTTRYEKYAAAQAWLTDSSLVMPTISLGATPRVTKVVPFSGAFSYGLGSKGGTTYKYVQLQSDTVTTSQYETAQKEWEEKRSAD